MQYHLRHSSQWVLRLGDGTAESHARIQTSFTELWRFTAEMFHVDEVERRLIGAGIAADSAALKPKWEARVAQVLSGATLQVPGEQGYYSAGSRQGKHTEYLGYILAEMQILPRSYPDAKW